MSVMNSLGRWMSECHPGTWAYDICRFHLPGTWTHGICEFIFLTYRPLYMDLVFLNMLGGLQEVVFCLSCVTCGLNRRVCFAWHLRTTALLEGTECTGEMSASPTGCRFAGVERVRSHILLTSWQGICVALSWFYHHLSSFLIVCVWGVVHARISTYSVKARYLPQLLPTF